MITSEELSSKRRKETMNRGGKSIKRKKVPRRERGSRNYLTGLLREVPIKYTIMKKGCLYNTSSSVLLVI